MNFRPTSNRPSSGREPMRGQGEKPPKAEDVESIDLSGIKLGATLSADLFSTVADKASKTVADADTKLNKASQLRRFYDELVMWQEKIGSSDDRFQEYKPYIYMLKAKVAYAKGRGHVDANFRAMLDCLICQSGDAKTLRHAKLFFEAFMAYYRLHRPTEK